VVAETEEAGPRLLVGMGTFLAIALHKPLDSLSITSIMTAGGWSVAARHWANVVFSLMCPLGCVIFVLGIHQVVERQHVALGAVLGLSAGGFLCISVADLMPELELHSHDRFRLSLALLLGVALAYAVHLFEPAHTHEHEHAGEHFTIKNSTRSGPRSSPLSTHARPLLPSRPAGQARFWQESLPEPLCLFPLSCRPTRCRFNVGANAIYRAAE
jgi:hypothetical protein